MKIVIRTAVFHLLCILIFALIYLYLSEHFQSDQTKNDSFTDFLLLSTTVQAGVGVSELYPISFYSKLVLIIQQVLLIFTHLITLYIFTL